MASPASLSVLGTEFDAFLFAPVGEDSNGMLLSVASALARLDLDPWQEAANLARLPGDTAAQKLASMIAAQPGMPLAYRDPGTIAARLTALLPRQVGCKVTSNDRRVTADDQAKVLSGTYMYAVLIVFMLVAQWISASHLSSKPDVDAPASGIGTSQLKPAGSAHADGSATALPKPETHAPESKLAR